MTDKEKMEYIIKTALELKELAKETGVDITIFTRIEHDFASARIGDYEYDGDGCEMGYQLYYRPLGNEVKDWCSVTPEQVDFSGSPGGTADGC